MDIVHIDQIPAKESFSPVKINLEDETVSIKADTWVPYTALYKEFMEMEHLCKNGISPGVGLSAVQVGKPVKCFVAFIKNNWRHFLNCKYKGMSRKKRSMEGCLSLPGKHFLLERYSKIKVWGSELIIDQEDGLRIIEVNAAFSGMNAVIMQHEIDHADVDEGLAGCRQRFVVFG